MRLHTVREHGELEEGERGGERGRKGKRERERESRAEQSRAEQIEPRPLIIRIFNTV